MRRVIALVGAACTYGSPGRLAPPVHTPLGDAPLPPASNPLRSRRSAAVVTAQLRPSDAAVTWFGGATCANSFVPLIKTIVVLEQGVCQRVPGEAE